MKCISFFGGATYFLTNDGLIYFCGIADYDNDEDIYEKLPILLESETKLSSLHFVTKYKSDLTFGSAVTSVPTDL